MRCSVAHSDFCVFTYGKHTGNKHLALPYPFQRNVLSFVGGKFIVLDLLKEIKRHLFGCDNLFIPIL